MLNFSFSALLVFIVVGTKLKFLLLYLTYLISSDTYQIQNCIQLWLSKVLISTISGLIAKNGIHRIWTVCIYKI